MERSGRGDKLLWSAGRWNDHDQENSVQVSGLTGVTAIAGGNYHSIALKNDGTVWTWDITTMGNWETERPRSKTPVQVSGLTGVTPLPAGIIIQ